MPTLVWLYLTAWRYDRTSSRGVALAEALEPVSQDRLTRLWPADGSGPRRLERAVRTLCSWERGEVILAATVIAKPVATAMEGLAWVCSRQEHTPVDGVSLVLLVWTDGTRRMPLGMRLWRQGGPSTSELALARLSDARHRWRCQPEDGLCEAWYPSTVLLKRSRDDGWSCVCRLKTHRRCNGQALRHHRRHPDWAESGQLSGGLTVLVVRDGKQDDATNRLTWPAAEVRRGSRVRPHMEEVMRVGTDQLRLTGCQARSERAQPHHITGGVVACGVLERARHDRHLSLSQRKRQLRFRGPSVVLPALERLRSAA